ncbi:trypsin-like peptidase domain-containing protein [Gilvimarinus sp. SDUM040013]|uniref:Trypsin-like peptidase domain-containing protein n=2 Tax=Gilvimarinus gilvus TaxID=3058038 RepID=A0ABU4S1M0_9GAMM|nr:trypsin-like peptidase domain-containing protein [Gilvimarinus sp. SDUM040013]MDO3386107.1 trypsin-like peptidase domain-containing protein [Gilvimarinus sp. SDUM040013]MDX6850352.1 trypsin-like peptidase domain-containing protein [Gilvimarinus sp. SDUM040013]
MAAPEFATDDERNTIEIFEFASPSVVYVNRLQVVRDRRSYDLLSIPRGAGTGFVWSEEGYIVTNYHVVEGALQVSITLPDQSSWPAKVVGLAADKDLAVLKIDAPKDKLRALPVGDSNELVVGRKVLAIGNPFGLDATLTTGIVSALGREIEAPNQRKIRNVIQTDAAINPGNSGGPLLNSEGELIGVNTMIYSPSGASAGIGFAIPVNIVKEIVPQLIEFGRLVRPVFGVEFAPAYWSRKAGVEGVALLHVAPGYPAALAGLRGARRGSWGRVELGDIVIALDDTPTRNQDEFLTVLEARQPGDEIVVHFVRDGRLEQTSVTLAEPQLD